MGLYAISPSEDTPNHKKALLNNNWVKWILLFFEKLNRFYVVYFFLIYYFYESLPHTEHKYSESQFHHQIPFFPQITSCFFQINFVYYLKIPPLWHQSINFFSQSIKNVSNKFRSLINFLRANWHNMYTMLAFWFSQKLKFFDYGVIIIATVMTLNPQFDFYSY